MHRGLFIFFTLLVTQSSFSQSKLTWDDLADVEFKPEYNEKYDVHFLMPTFGEKIKAYQGKKVKVIGYFLDISGTGEVFLISSNPMASCFFCGGAGPESIIEVNFTKIPPFTTDKVVEVTGTLRLNRDDVDHCNYILNGALGELVN
ncbi:MAG: hypothetical protein AAGC45_07115 [Bacteroidota bacterium]